nr:putative ribonuclease H-like domain-containing protein [Tanacetum cinerariifolium]
MTTLAEHLIVAGAENRPPMLEKSMYDSWSSRICLFIKGKKNGRMMLDSIDNDPLQGEDPIDCINKAMEFISTMASRFKPLSDDGKKVDDDPSKKCECNDQEKKDNVNSTNNVNTVSLTINAASTNDVNVDGGIISSAFIYGKIKEEVRVCQPSGFEDPDFLDTVYKVEKALYGLHQAHTAWYETLSTYLLDNGFQRGRFDKTLFIKRHKGDIFLHVAYEAVHKELGDSLVRAATTASSLGAEQDNGKIDKTQFKATPNESSLQGTDSGGGPKCQETIGDTTAQTRFESVSKDSNYSLLARGNTLRSDEDRMKLNELMALCTTLQNMGRIEAIDVDEDITLVNDQDDADKDMFDVNVLGGEEPKKKDQIRFDEEAAKRLQAEFDKEAQLAREKVVKEQKGNITLIEEWNDIQAKIDVDYQLAERLQEQKQEELTELVKGKEKRAGEELVHKSTKKQKVEDNKEKDELKQLMETIPNEEEVAIDVIPLAVKSSRIIDRKIHKEGRKNYYQIIRADGKSQIYMFFS